VRQSSIAALLMLVALGAGCTVGPRYARPSAPAPAPDAWKTQAPWQQAAPKDAVPKGSWWQVFEDPALDSYEQQLLQAAMVDGILKTADQNARTTLTSLLQGLGFEVVEFVN